MAMDPKMHDVQSWLDCIREALDVAEDNLTEQEWDEVNTAWAWIVETLEEFDVTGTRWTTITLEESNVPNN